MIEVLLINALNLLAFLFALASFYYAWRIWREIPYKNLIWLFTGFGALTIVRIFIFIQFATPMRLLNTDWCAALGAISSGLLMIAIIALYRVAKRYLK